MHFLSPSEHSHPSRVSQLRRRSCHQSRLHLAPRLGTTTPHEGGTLRGVVALAIDLEISNRVYRAPHPAKSLQKEARSPTLQHFAKLWTSSKHFLGSRSTKPCCRSTPGSLGSLPLIATRLRADLPRQLSSHLPVVASGQKSNRAQALGFLTSCCAPVVRKLAKAPPATKEVEPRVLTHISCCCAAVSFILGAHSKHEKGDKIRQASAAAACV